jgi:hypothetical protein
MGYSARIDYGFVKKKNTEFLMKKVIYILNKISSTPSL